MQKNKENKQDKTDVLLNEVISVNRDADTISKKTGIPKDEALSCMIFSEIFLLNEVIIKLLEEVKKGDAR